MKARPIAALTLFASAALFSLSQMPVSPERVVEYHRTPGSLFEPHTTVLFGGDMMFDRYIRQTMDNYGGNFIFSCIADVLSSADLVVANLEGPITEYTSVSLGSEVGKPDNFIFTFPTEVATLLVRYNIRLVSLGNNHTLNLGWDGMHSTRAALRAARVGYFGVSPREGQESGSFDGASKIENINGVPLAFINYNEFALEGWRANAEAARAQIVEARKHGYLPIVYTHWGDEYATISVPRQRVLAHDFVDAGAEMVIGSHPHVIEESEL
ncbi:MAG: Enzyme of poly-gamma-glutamate biosynthesis (Capsule formation) [Candidatus Adlerbacteria bacterium GW2011_GWC1_50_9]|nr:MAG: Enzyme of poly-gamma-glutamate biosynthesis (Capsule formation) [Candidatus Adlerbacteria bacterium GW2011_GWC1_50_9]